MLADQQAPEADVLLITGGMGFIGLHTARRFLDAGQEVVLTQFKVRREPGFLPELRGGSAHVELLDVADPEAMRQVVGRYSVSGIIHLAVPGLGALGPADDYRTNTTALLNVLEAARQARVRRVTIASSIAVYRGLPRGPYREQARLPLPSGNPTEAFKKAEEVLGSHYADRTGLDIAFARIGGAYGPLYHSMANLPSRLCHAAVKGEQPNLSSRGGGVALADDESDLVYIKDCAAGLFLLHTADRLRHRVYNIGGGRAVTNRELAAAVSEVTGLAVEFPAGRGRRSWKNGYLDLTRSRRDLGYEPEYDVRRGVAEYVEWLRANPE